MKFKQLMALALIGFAVGACKRPDGGEDPTNVDPEGKLVKAKLAVSIPNGIRTYAPPGDGDVNATDEEIAANTIDLFIYENGGTYALTYYRFQPTAAPDFNSSAPPGDGEFKNQNDLGAFVTDEFDVREGEKLVYVGINLPDLIVNRLKTGYYVNEVFENIDLINQLAKDPLAGATAGGSKEVAFFNTARQVVNVTSASATLIAVPVSRLVAKVVVRAVDEDDNEGNAASWEVSGGTVSELEFAIGQRNNQMYVAPLVGNDDPNLAIPSVGALSPSGSGIPMLQDVKIADYLSVNDLSALADANTTNMLYATENTTGALTNLARHQDATYVSIRAKFAPHRFGADPASGELPESGSPAFNTTPPPNGFYAVFTGDNTDGEDALGVRYFTNADMDVALADARAFVEGGYFATMSGLTITPSTPGAPYDPAALALETDHYIHFYPESYCYYRIYLNPGTTIDGTATTTGTGNYEILRNTVHLATITGINYIGTTGKDILPGSVDANGKGTPTYPGAWFPNNLLPAAVLPTDEIKPMATWKEGLSVSITLTPWDPDEQNYETY